MQLRYFFNVKTLLYNAFKMGGNWKGSANWLCTIHTCVGRLPGQYPAVAGHYSTGHAHLYSGKSYHGYLLFDLTWP